jgi:hypothetical protein
MTKYPETDKLKAKVTKADHFDILKPSENYGALLESKDLYCDGCEDEDWYSPKELSFEIRNQILEKLLTFGLRHKTLVRGFMEKQTHSIRRIYSRSIVLSHVARMFEDCQSSRLRQHLHRRLLCLPEWHF